MVKAVYREFDARAFLETALDGYDALALMQRGARIAESLHAHLPRDYPHAIGILIASVDGAEGLPRGNPLASFLYLPHTQFAAKYGLDHFDASMHAQYVLTQRFSAEFSLRSFIERDQTRTMDVLRHWAADPNEHVRRLVSEGTRPRLPWGIRLKAFQKDPRPVLDLLEMLKDDPSLYVRRSVANSLNDIGKDHPALLVQTAARWMKNASPDRQWIIRHALRSAVKRGEPGALKLLGFGTQAKTKVGHARISPARVRRGGKVAVSFDMVNSSRKTQRLLVDLRVHYVKANGKSSAKVFKLRTVELPPHGTASFSKKLVLKDLTTRKHYPGVHRIEALVNGRAAALGKFTLLAP